jgi:hypothetical protein
MAETSDKQRYAVVYGRNVEYFVRPPCLSGQKYREPKRMHPQGFKSQYSTKLEALEAARKWSIKQNGE